MRRNFCIAESLQLPRIKLGYDVVIGADLRKKWKCRNSLYISGEVRTFIRPLEYLINEVGSRRLPARARNADYSYPICESGKKRCVHFNRNAVFFRLGNVRRIERHTGGLQYHI